MFLLGSLQHHLSVYRPVLGAPESFVDRKHFFRVIGKVRLFKHPLNLTATYVISHLKFETNSFLYITAIECVPPFSFIGFSHLSEFRLDATMVGVIIRFYQLGQNVDIGQSVFSC